MEAIIKESFVCYDNKIRIDFDENETIKVIDIGFDKKYLTQVFITFKSEKSPKLFTCDIGLILENIGRHDFSQKTKSLIQTIRNYLLEKDNENALKQLNLYFTVKKFGL